jgi:hypothetical protein
MLSNKNVLNFLDLHFNLQTTSVADYFSFDSLVTVFKYDIEDLGLASV